MRPPWGHFSLLASVTGLVLIIAGFSWNGWLKSKTPELHSLQETSYSNIGHLIINTDYGQTTHIVWPQIMQIVITIALIIFVTGLCLLSLHVSRCILYPKLILNIYIVLTIIGVGILCTPLLMAVTVIEGEDIHSLTWGYYVEWGAVLSQSFSAGLAVLERLNLHVEVERGDGTRNHVISHVERVYQGY